MSKNKDEFDVAPDMEPDPDMIGDARSSDSDMDFSEFEDKKQSASLGSLWQNNPVVKFGLIAAGILVVVAIVTLFGGSKEEASTSFVGSGDNTFKEAPGTNEVTPVMKEAVEEKNQQRIEEAEKFGGSAIPTPIEAPKTLLDLPDDAGAGEDPLLRWKQMQEERARALRDQQAQQAQTPQGDPARDAQLQNMVAGMTAQVGEILGKEKKIGLQNIKVFDMDQLKQAQQSGLSPEQLAATAQSNGGANTPAKVILPAGKIEYGQMLLEANSDVPGPVMAAVVSGAFKGSKLIGSFSTQKKFLVVRFNALVTKAGTSIPIDAYAVDPSTSLTGVVSDVDNRYFERIVLPAAAKFVEGLGEAYAQTTSETTQNSTTTTTSTEDLNTKQEFGKAVSEAAQKVGEVLDEDGSVGPLVRLFAGAPLGVMFMKSITDQDILSARQGVSSEQQNAQQQQQMLLQLIQQNQSGQTNGAANGATAGGVVAPNVLQQLQSQLQAR